MSGIKELYGVLKGKVSRYDECDARINTIKPHVHIYVKVNNIEYDIAVNTKSAPRNPIIINGKKVENDLLYIANSKFNAKQITHLQNLKQGFYPIKYHNEFVFHRTDYPKKLHIKFPSSKYNPKDIAVDFIRSNLFNPCEMKVLPSTKIGPDNDLADFFQKQIGDKAIKKHAIIYVYGGHFNKGKGIHEVHMNQGSIGDYEFSNGVFQDGCILLQYPNNHWEGIFLAFQSQTWDTNDKTGNSEGESFIYDHESGESICKPLK
ncbi:YukJ family protein [Clostridium sp. SHJSY1]|uniref:YukJ family protein n=1 Tax=Clostridium sp. SHJSY1 TaxID=2942483 RepID=UPI0028769C4B|nr:YukJ family protein [Clostridium sp. SHJSY1]MDS0525197.1 YukJ family protein [Clostridium sp. SHJSY1]